MNEVVQKARDRTISPGELQGSTFTITNVGGIGGEYATPIINYPGPGSSRSARSSANRAW